MFRNPATPPRPIPAPAAVAFALLAAVIPATLMTLAPGSAAAQLPPTQQDSPDAALQQLVLDQQAALHSGDGARILPASEQLAALTLRLLGDLDLERADPAAAAEHYRQSIAAADTPDARLSLALTSILRHQPADALAQTSVVTAAHPEDARAWRLTGQALLLQQQPAALDALNRAWQLQPQLETGLLLTTAAAQMHRPADAAAVIRQITATAGDSARLHVLFASAWHQGGDLTDTIAELTHAVTLDAQLGPAHLALGNAYWELNAYQYNADALREFTAAQRLDPAAYFSNYDLGSLQSQYHQYDQAAISLKQAAAADPASPDPWLVLGANAYEQLHLAEAEAHLQKCITLTGADEARNGYQVRRAYLLLNRIAVEQGQTQTAERLLAQANRLQESAVRDHVASAVTESATLPVMQAPANAAPGHAEPGHAESGEAGAAGIPSASDPTSGPASVPRPPSPAEQQRAGQLRAILAHALNDAGTVHARAQDYAAALTLFRAAAAADPALAPVMRNLGLAAFHTGQYGEAATALAEALQQNPNDTLARTYLERTRAAQQQPSPQ